jgi:ADP-dependent phosphofructokinase/glucokinase
MTMSMDGDGTCMPSLERYLDAIRDVSVLCAYNANVDAVTDVGPELEATLDPPHANPVDHLESPSDLATAVTRSMAEGRGDEREITGALADWLVKHVRPDERRVGGQAGIMADYLTVVGGSPVLYAFLLSETQKSMFQHPSEIRFPVVNGALSDDSLLLRPLTETESAPSTKVNWIFEFERGTELFGTTATATTRFIAASRPEAFTLETGALTAHTEALGERANCAILGGYHALKREYADGTTYMDQLDHGREFLEVLGRGTPVQIEYGVTHDEALRAAIVEEIVPAADVLSLDSGELALLSRDLGLPAPEPDIESRCEVLRTIRDELGLSAVKLHARNYFVAVTDGYVAPEYVRKGFRFAAIAAAAKARHGRLTDVSQLEDGASVEPPPAGAESVKRVADEADVVAVANRVFVDHASTVGIGDVVSCSSFVLERALEGE